MRKKQERKRTRENKLERKTQDHQMGLLEK